MTDTKQHTELVVLGAGPGGYPAAFEAADHGLDVTLVNAEEKPGGVCLHRGCIPSKALLHVAQLLHETREVEHAGITFENPKIDLDKLRDFKNSVIGKLTGGIGELARTRGVKMINARGIFQDANTLLLDHLDGQQTTLTFDKAIIATGSSPAMPGFFDIGDSRVMDSTGALALEDVPDRLLVIGGGYIGLEMGTVYSSLGSEVTVVEMTSRLLPGCDRDLIGPLKRRLEKIFKAINLDTRVAGLEATDDGIVASLEHDGETKTEMFDRVLVSIGRRPNSQGVGLEAAGVAIDEKGFVTINAQRQTSVSHIYAIGDVAGEPMLAHKATREAKVAVEAIVGEPSAFDYIAIPAVVFTDPEIAWCGVTETEAKQRKLDVNVSRFPWAASGRAQSLAQTDGLTKLITDKETSRVLGMGIVGRGAGEMIAEGVIAVEMAVVARELADSIHAHPTLSETIMESAESVIGQATHLYRPKRK